MSDSSLARSSAVMALGTVASRLLGFVRTSTLTAVVGIGLAADTFDVANTLPNQFYLLLAGGVLNAVLVPQITKAATHDDGGHEFVNRLLTLSFAIIAAATVVITLLAPVLVRIFARLAGTTKPSGWPPPSPSSACPRCSSTGCTPCWDRC